MHIFSYFSFALQKQNKTIFSGGHLNPLTLFWAVGGGVLNLRSLKHDIISFFPFKCLLWTSFANVPALTSGTFKGIYQVEHGESCQDCVRLQGVDVASHQTDC